MGNFEDAFQPLDALQEATPIADLLQRPALAPETAAAAASAGVVTAWLHGFDLDDRALLTGLPHAPHAVVAARSTVGLRHAMIGQSVVVVFERNDPAQPIILGVLQACTPRLPATEPPALSVQADDQRFLVRAEREIELRCGDASITLTRAGKVIIKGRYILSRSSGYNKLKGAAVDIN
jgi:hypothetical protein